MIASNQTNVETNNSVLLLSMADIFLDAIDDDNLRSYLNTYINPELVELLIKNERSNSLVSQIIIEEYLGDAFKLPEFNEISYIDFKRINENIKIAGLLKNTEQIYKWLTSDYGQNLLANFSHKEIRAALELSKIANFPIYCDTIIEPEQAGEIILQDGAECFINWVAQFPEPIQRLLLLATGRKETVPTNNTKQDNSFKKLFQQVMEFNIGDSYVPIN